MSPSAGLPALISDREQTEQRSWREGNAVVAGAIAGTLIGAGVAVHRAWRNDFTCPAEVMAPCWIEVPIITAYGTGAGTFLGWIFSLPGKPRVPA